ncbi:hypothetical protein LTSEADE_4550 [Salmonella enterica subsp. enterica serovar Adelaide str. A4-669]|uniref:Uncharacterized protein n=1 Tax=Salmonella enterica subsp. enterica serovar Adelaide str. A4-669 TaxID=913063 RepID=A0A6C8GHF7_SALET|nr:hypothetical protein LTSEADE_4550 [Salmonella enterica subsp. enterica serovar Adelaide str. A4-669]
MIKPTESSSPVRRHPLNTIKKAPERPKHNKKGAGAAPERLF